MTLVPIRRAGACPCSRGREMRLIFWRRYKSVWEHNSRPLLVNGKPMCLWPVIEQHSPEADHPRNLQDWPCLGAPAAIEEERSDG